MAARFEPLSTLLRTVGDAIGTLDDRLATTADVQDLLADQGLLVDVVPASLAATTGAVAKLGDALAAFATAADGSDAGAVITSAVALGGAITDAGAALKALPAALQRELAGLADELAAIDVVDLGERIFERQLVDHLAALVPALIHGLSIAGLVDGDDSAPASAPGVLVPPGGDLGPLDETPPTTADRTGLRVQWARFAPLVNDPRSVFADAYGWGTASFEGARLLARVYSLLRALGLPARLEASGARPAMPASVEVDGAALAAPLFAASGGPIAIEAGLTAAIVRPSASETDGGIALGAYLDGDATASFAIAEGVTLALSASAALGSGLVLVLRAPFAVTAIADPAGAATAAAAQAALTFRWAPAGGLVPLALDGVATLTLEAIEVSVGVAPGDGGAVAPTAALRLVGGTFSIAGGSGDSFLAQILGSGCTATFDLGVSWAPGVGVRFDGAAGLSVQITLNAALGPVHLDWISVDLAVTGSGASLELRATGGLALGPFTASVDGIGVGLALATAALDGNLGAFQLESPAFLAPHGLGLALDLGALGGGGGYLDLDPDAGQYAGVLQLELLAVGITAIGVLTTRMPDGRAGWSLFLALSATFTGVQLGFGFTLNGVGGLVGVNRSVDLDALSDGVRTGALEDLLFPADPIADAPRILAELDAIFPPAPGQYVFGPIARIGWGTPTLATADLGVIIQLPDPLTISLIGAFTAVLPDADAPVLVLHLDVAGTLDVTAGTLSIDASLHDSHVAGLALSGDMALRAAFLDQPSFLMAFGGFNPRFVPPADFPELARLAVALDGGDVLRIQLAGYFAITSNTVQFGASCSLVAHAIGLTAEGNFELDALLQFSPFFFVIDLGFDVSVSAGSLELFGVHLALTLEGPNPWYGLGTATVKILGVKKDLRVEATMGRSLDEPSRDAADVHALLVAALADASAWTEVPPDADARAVTVGPGSATDASLRVHPAGLLDVRQRVVPLDRTLDCYGNDALAGADRFSLTNARLGTAAAAATPVDDWFAPAQFFTLADEDKLSAPSFEQMTCGLRLGDPAIDAGTVAPFALGYEQIVRDPDVAAAERALDALHAPTTASLAVAVARGPAATARGRAGLARSTAPTSAFALAPTRYVVTDASTGAVATRLTPAAGVSWSSARELANTDGGDDLQVVPAYEAA